MSRSQSQLLSQAASRWYTQIVKGTAWFSCLVLCVTLVVTTVFLPDNHRFPTAPQSQATAIAVMTAGFLCSVLAVVVKCPKKPGMFQNRSLAFGAGAAIVFFQVLLVYYLSYGLTWDPFALLDYAHATLVHDQHALSHSSTYFSRYPNNTFIAVVFAAWYRMLAPIGAASLSGLALVSALHVDVAALMLVRFLRLQKYRSITRLWIVAALLVLVVLSAWIIIPYSDTFALPYVAASFTLFSSALKEQSAPSRAGLLLACGISAAIAYAFKPSNLVVLIALILCLPLAETKARRKIGATLALFTVALGGFVATLSATNVISHTFEQPLDPEKAFTWHHYLLMGANENNFGAYNQEDVELSASIENLEERSQTDLELAKQRILERSALDNCIFYATKLQRLYSDGSFNALYEGQAPEGDRLWPRSPAVLADALRNIYYHNRGSSVGLRTVQSILWTMILSLALGGIILRSPSRMSTLQLALVLSMIGLTAFLVVFESRPRYLFVFIPVILMLAAIGLEELRTGYQNLLNRRKD